MRGFEDRLKGGHPNSLGNTVEVVEEVVANPELFDKFFECYFSEDELVRLRVSNGMKRICKANKKLLLPYMDRFLCEISAIEQASTQWTLSNLFGLLSKEMSEQQVQKAKILMKHNLANHTDWIVLNTTMDTLGKWAQSDDALKEWLLPHLERISKDERKSVSGRAKKIIDKLA